MYIHVRIKNLFYSGQVLWLILFRSRRNSKYTPSAKDVVMYSKGSEKVSPISLSPQKNTKMSANELEANLEQPDEQTYENTAFLGKLIAYVIIHIPDAVIYWLLHI